MKSRITPKVSLDAIEGVIDNLLSYHYDVTSDVLYVRHADKRETPAFGEQDHRGIILLRQQDNDDLIGATFVNFWHRLNRGPLPDSITEIHRHIEPAARTLAA